MIEDLDVDPIRDASISIRHNQGRLLDGSYLISGLAEKGLNFALYIDNVELFNKALELLGNSKFATTYISHPEISRYNGIYAISSPRIGERVFNLWDLAVQANGPMKRWRNHWFSSELFTDYDDIKLGGTARSVWDFEGTDEDTAAELVNNFEWEMITGTWAETDGEGPEGTGDLAIRSSTTPTNEIFVFGPTWISDMSISIQTKIQTAGDQTGLIFRLKDSSNYYLVVLDASADTIALVKRENASNTTLKSVSATIDVEVYYHLKIETAYNRFSVYLDGILAFEYYDNTFRVGRTGFFANGAAEAFFDNLYYKIRKPVRIGLPAGYIGVNQGVDIIERQTARDILASLIDPVSPITFNQYLKSLPDRGGDTRLLLHFDEGIGTTAYDSSGNELEGTLSGGTAWETGKNKWFRKCLRLDAVTEIMTVGDNTLIDFAAADSFSIGFWFLAVRQGSSTVDLMDKYSAGDIGYRVQFNNNDGTIIFQIGDGTFTPSITSDNGLSQTEWSYVVAIRDVTNDELRLYVNGVSAATAVPDTTTGTLVNSEDLVVKGTGTNDVDFDDLEIRGSVIPATEIATSWTHQTIGIFGGGDVICWDDTDSVRVYDWDHEFAGHIDVLNELLKLQLNNTDSYLYFYGFGNTGSGGDWIETGKFRFRYYLVEEATTLISDEASSWDFSIREIGPDRVILRLYHDFTTYGVTGIVDVILRKGCRHVLFDFSMNSSRITTCAPELISSLNYRFLYVAQPEGDISSSFLDAEFDSTGSVLATLIDDNFALMIEEDTNNDLVLGMFCTDNPTLAFDSNNIAPFGQVATATEFSHLRAYTERRQVGFMLIPFDISTMFQESEDATFGGTAGSGADVGNASNDSVAVLDASGESVYYSVSSLAPGAYTAFFRLKDTGTGTVVLDVYNNTDAVTLATRTVAEPDTTYVDVSLDFIIDGDDDGDTIYIRATWSAGTIWVDYQGFIPLTDGKNQIGDVAHQGLRMVELNRSGEMD
jgi:hypothetical protein